MTYRKPDTVPNPGDTVPGWTPEVGTRLNSVIRRLGGLSAASRIVGTTDESISKWVKGKARAPFAAISALASEAGVSLDWLAGRSEHEGAQQVLAPKAREPGQEHGQLPLIEAALMGRVIMVVRRTLAELNMRLSDNELAEIYLEICSNVIARAEGPEDYPALVDLAGNRLRRDLITQKPGSGKRSASAS